MTDDRIITGIASKEVEDMEKRIIDISSMHLKEMRKTKTFLFNHVEGEQIGNVIKVWKNGDELWFKARFYAEGKNDFVDALYFFFKKGILKAFSVGVSYPKKRVEGNRYHDVVLDEISLVPIGANPKALLKGIDKNNYTVEEGAKKFDEFMQSLEIKEPATSNDYEETKDVFIKWYKVLKLYPESYQDRRIKEHETELKHALSILKK